MLQKIKIVLLLILIVLVVVLGLLNRDPTDVDLLFTKVAVPTTLLLFLTAGIGFLAGLLAALLWSHRRARRQREKEAAAAAAE